MEIMVDVDRINTVMSILNSMGYDVYFDEYDGEIVIDGDENDLEKVNQYLKLSGLLVDIDNVNNEVDELEVEYKE